MNSAVRMPPGLTAEMRKAWKVIVADMERLGTLDPSDGHLIELAATQLGRVREARAELARQAAPAQRRKRGMSHLMAPTVRGSTSNYLLAVEREATKEFRLLSDLLEQRIRSRGASGADRPKNLAEVRDRLQAV